ncbi:DUF2062 domain-containing protein [Stratiformator vulcanicus]|uniref:DUF2062 domain-containing protein n=1 Tax=Stratiformator vulcanicus TaxID=2527980 RepID=A0A517R0W5_9PLAN|nr:DUF2062 domain-containing protein [Stratiformator vulcanicus]QDT37474.1 hypothetical protein Pan189_18540 [Stratiformator vulcanicus]
MAAEQSPPKSGRSKSPDLGRFGWANPRTIVRYLLSLDDTPHRVALGFAVGIFVGLTPTVGVQMILVGMIWYLCRRPFDFNCRAGIVSCYISNPITTIPIYWFSYCVGWYFTGGDLTRDEFAKAFQYSGFSEWWATVWKLFIEIGWPLVIGSLIVATIGAVIAYPAIYYLLIGFRAAAQKRREAHRKKVRERRRTESPSADEPKSLVRAGEDAA